MKLRALSAALISATLVVAACGAPKPKPRDMNLVQLLSQHPRSFYAARCDDHIDALDAFRARPGYVPLTLDVVDWKAGGEVTPTALSEEEFLELLSEQRIRFGLVEARGGLGKSKLVEAIEAQVCRDMAVFRFDVKSTIVPGIPVRGRDENAVFNEIARAVGMDEADADLRALRRALGSFPWILLLDAMDEVTVEDRAAVVAEIQAFIQTYSQQAHVIVFSRPPVFDNLFGFDSLDARLTIRPLACTTSDQKIRTEMATEAKDRAFRSFVKEFGIDRQVVEGNRCRYAHMASFRDAEVVAEVARDASFLTTAPGAGALYDATRATLYERYVPTLVKREMNALARRPREVLELADLMVRHKDPRTGTRSIHFKRSECIAALRKEVQSADQTERHCKLLLDSELFERSGETFEWRFANQSVADYFLARWLDRKVDDEGCSALREYAPMFESSEIAGFLVGLERGRTCAIETLRVLCLHGTPQATAVDLLDQGLPTGDKRREILGAAAAMPAQAPGRACVHQAIEHLLR